jgi:hypothetical protein
MRKLFASECFVDPAWRTPALRPNRADMSRTAFRRLIAAWSGSVAGLLLVMILIRQFH